jgi:HD superfamily phosphodiesterase
MNIQKTIEQAEYKWLSEVYNFCRNGFSSTYLPSHDETHHFRVWHFAKALIPGYHSIIHPFTTAHIEGILLAAMLHDTGMSETLDVNHGRAGRHLAVLFLNKMPSIPELADDILDAIEKHDDKSYSSESSREKDEGIILTILSLADDMDAFGAIGVFRYYEIYLLRGITVGKMAGKVLPNLDRRYDAIENRLQSWPKMLSDIEKRYRTTRGFFEDLQASDPRALNVTDIFESVMRKPRLKPEEAMPEILKNVDDPYMAAFFAEMQRELFSSH